MIPRHISQPFYKSTRWKKCRQGYIQSVGGLCERCLKKGIVRKGYIVHHKQYVTEENITDPDVTLNWANLEYLCHECHNHEHFGESKTTREDVQFDSNGNLIKKVSPLKKSQSKALREREGTFE